MTTAYASTDDDTALSTGAIAGIVIATIVVIICVMVALAVGIYYYYHQRQSAKVL